jgi:hypothetical protein
MAIRIGKNGCLARRKQSSTSRLRQLWSECIVFTCHNLRSYIGTTQAFKLSTLPTYVIIALFWILRISLSGVFQRFFRSHPRESHETAWTTLTRNCSHDKGIRHPLYQCTGTDSFMCIVAWYRRAPIWYRLGVCSTTTWWDWLRQSAWSQSQGLVSPVVHFRAAISYFSMYLKPCKLVWSVCNLTMLMSCNVSANSYSPTGSVDRHPGHRFDPDTPIEETVQFSDVYLVAFVDITLDACTPWRGQGWPCSLYRNEFMLGLAMWVL